MKSHIIIIHEIYGITKNLIELKEYLERLGFSVSLPSLYQDNYVGTDEDISYNKFYTQVGLDKSIDIINEVIQHNQGSEIILLGFSIGATIAWLHSTNIRINKVIGIYGSKIRKFLNIEPMIQTYLFFCEEKLFNVEELNRILNIKRNVSSSIIHGEHGFYGKKDFNGSMIKKMNEEILRIIEL
jgi:dienelactone hydrolase